MRDGHKITSKKPLVERMENLSLQDLPPAGGPNHVQPALGGPPQLPPQVDAPGHSFKPTDTDLLDVHYCCSTTRSYRQ